VRLRARARVRVRVRVRVRSAPGAGCDRPGSSRGVDEVNVVTFIVKSLPDSVSYFPWRVPFSGIGPPAERAARPLEPVGFLVPAGAR